MTTSNKNVRYELWNIPSGNRIFAHDTLDEMVTSIIENEIELDDDWSLGEINVDTGEERTFKLKFAGA